MTPKILPQKEDNRPIGVFDSGIGGLIALTALAKALPQEDLVYLGDTARVPYGDRSPEIVKNYARECVQFLLDHSVKLIVVACNTVSAIALSEIEKISPVPVIGVIKPAVSAVSAVLLTPGYKKIGIIGTRVTVQSRSYEHEIYKIHGQAGLLIYAQACPLFVPLIEEGWHEDPFIYPVAEKYLRPLKEEKIDALILGCTHYPLLRKVIEEIMPGVVLIDPAEEATKQTVQIIQQYASQNAYKERQIECYVTDLAPTFVRMVNQFLGVSPEAIRHVSIG
ncbi:MAG: murI [Gammaproteobacteria bacterium]|jgi:glutamate racemase|nr:murI [Gammaproteobacteria bacterium]